MSDLADIIDAHIEKHNELREVYSPGNVICYLLKREGQSKRFTVIAEIDSGYFSKWNNYREQTQFMFATLDEGFGNLMAQTSFIAFGTPDPSGELSVYAVSDDMRDKVEPDGTSPFWKVYGMRNSKERFNVNVF